MTLKIDIDDKFLSFVISKDNKDFDWAELDKLEQIKVISAICNAYEFFSRHCKQYFWYCHLFLVYLPKLKR